MQYHEPKPKRLILAIFLCTPTLERVRLLNSYYKKNQITSALS